MDIFEVLRMVEGKIFENFQMPNIVIIIGAGLVVLRGGHLTGITTAAGLWVSAGVGMACGFGLYTLALFATGLSLVIFTVLWMIERDYVQRDLAKKLGREKTIKEANGDES
jgi:uncharacterized membrane protein YhiD involved in acid resistance